MRYNTLYQIYLSIDIDSTFLGDIMIYLTHDTIYISYINLIRIGP